MENTGKGINYVKKGAEGIYGVPTGYKYGKYKQGLLKDNGKPLKKNGRKLGTTMVSLPEVALKIGRVVNLMTFGAKEIKNEKNIKKGIKPNVPLNIVEACNETGISRTNFYYYTNKYPQIKEQYNTLREQRREYMKEISEMNIHKAISGKMKTLKEKDVVDYSFEVLKLTDKSYNPKQVIEQTVEEINPDRTTEDIIADIASLLR